MTKAFWCGIIITSKGFVYYEEFLYEIKIYRALTYKPDYETMLGTYPTLANYNYKTDNSGYGYITITSLKQLMQLTKEIG